MQKKKEKGQSQADNKVLFKMIVVGDASVGKSCILAKYTKKEYKMDYNVTIGVEFCSKHVQINNTQVKLQIWDTAGQEAFRSIVGSFYKNAKAVLLIYDITNRQSFQKIETWLKECKEHCAEQVVLVLVGNKSDLEAKREVTIAEGEQLKSEKGMHLFCETSALDGTNIDEVFKKTATLTLDHYQSSGSLILYEDNIVKLLDKNKHPQERCNLNPCGCQ